MLITRGIEEKMGYANPIDVDEEDGYFYEETDATSRDDRSDPLYWIGEEDVAKILQHTQSQCPMARKRNRLEDW
jgi:hypothetical protein